MEGTICSVWPRKPTGMRLRKPSRSEGFGISLVEAMAMGIPCAACDLGGPAQILEGGKYGTLFKTGDPDDLAEALGKIFDNFAACRAVAMKSMSYVKEEYHIAQMCARLEEQMR